MKIHHNFILILCFMMILIVTQSFSSMRQHKFSPAVSTQLSNAIKDKILKNLNKLSDIQFANQLKQDLNFENDSDRKLKQISVKSANQLFGIFNIKGIVCDKNNDGIIIKEELQCLNYIWKYYVPNE